MLDYLFRPEALHIPDAFLSLPVIIVFWVLTVLLVAAAIRHTQDDFSERQIPLMGVMAAFIFAAQMINFPVAGGTSGHMLGGALAAITLGPWGGMLVMTSVVSIQALVFQDGGFAVMGANIFNMGLVTAIIGYGVYRMAAGRSKNVRLWTAGAAAWLSVLAGAFMTAIQLWLSGTTSLGLVMPAMMGVHTLIGIGEGLITIAALAFITRTRPDLVSSDAAESGRNDRGWVLAGFAAALLVVLVSPYASTSPDGLERVASDLGFIQTAASAPYEIIPDYTVPFLGESGFSTIAAGVIGMVIVAAAAWGIVAMTRRSSNP